MGRLQGRTSCPHGKVLLPGVIDSTNNYIEHPELIAQRITNIAGVVGRENVIAGSDCGFATVAGYTPVDPKITWAKLAAMSEGARGSRPRVCGSRRSDDSRLRRLATGFCRSSRRNPMAIRTGNDVHTYEVVEGWGMWAASGIDGSFDVAGVGVLHSRGQVYLFSRGERPVIVLNEKGEFIRAWGDKKMFPNAHAVTIGPDDSVWLTDTFDHTVRKCTGEGEVLLTLGASGKPAPSMSGLPFCRCTHVAIHPATGDLFVSDGYGNASVHKYSPDGRLLYSWGEPGNRPGQFNLPHNIATDRDGYVYVADRENSRVQVFTANGKLEDIWNGAPLRYVYRHPRFANVLHRRAVIGVVVSERKGPLGDLQSAGLRSTDGLLSLDGELQATLLDNAQGEAPDQMIAPHGIAVDAAGAIYVGEVSITAGLWFPRKDKSKQLRIVTKLAKVKRPEAVN